MTVTTIALQVPFAVRAVNCYLLEGDPLTLIDPGADWHETMVELEDALADRGLRVEDVEQVILTHQHYDHHSGLRALFDQGRRITVRFFFENRDPYPNDALAELRDSVAARRDRGELTWRDTDDPCADGRPVCTITMRGGAKLHIMRPLPRSRDANERSTPLKLVGPDSASFTMWLAGDAEQQATAWFDSTGYDVRPGMDVDVLKADHHGSCNGVTARYLAEVRPRRVLVSVGAENDYGHMHEQAKAAYRAAGVSDFIFVGVNACQALRSLLERAGAV